MEATAITNIMNELFILFTFFPLIFLEYKYP